MLNLTSGYFKCGRKEMLKKNTIYFLYDKLQSWKSASKINFSGINPDAKIN